MANLKLLTFFCLIAFSWANSALNRSAAHRIFQMTLEECKEEVGATTADIQDLLNRQAPSTVTGKCFRSCLMKKYKVMDSDGKFDKMAALEEARKLTNGDVNKMQLVQTLLNACSDIEVSSDDCEAADEYGQCFREQVKRLGLQSH